MTNNPSKNIWDNFTKTSKIGPKESLNAAFFFFNSLPKLLKETFQSFSSNLLNFRWPLSAEVGVKLLFAYQMITWPMSHVTRWMRYPHLNNKGYSKSNKIQRQKDICITNWGSFVLLQIRENVVTNWGSFIITN